MMNSSEHCSEQQGPEGIILEKRKLRSFPAPLHQGCILERNLETHFYASCCSNNVVIVHYISEDQKRIFWETSSQIQSLVLEFDKNRQESHPRIYFAFRFCDQFLSNLGSYFRAFAEGKIMQIFCEEAGRIISPYMLPALQNAKCFL